MKHFFTKQMLLATVFLPSLSMASVNITECQGWFESGYIKWAPVEGATGYNVYYKASNAADYIRLDNELVREYVTYGRADVLGIKAGDYQFKVVPTNATGEMSDEATESTVFTARAHDRSGFAHLNHPDGIGAYKNDGTLKDNAQVLYVYASNAKTITRDVLTSTKGTYTTCTGIQDIIAKYEKGIDTTPLAIRIIGTLKKDDMDELASKAEGLQIKGKNNTIPMNITLEGVGDDATIHGFGMLLRNAYSVELRNFGVMICLDDCISLDTDNSHVWAHNIDFFYGGTGSDSDQAKGDGSIDVKDDSKYVTISYCHFFDSGKCSLCGMKSESGENWITYHHNWFDHSDSRHARIRTMSVHLYNNYYDGNAKYGVGCTMGGNAFVENNYFRNCNDVMMISGQGTDATGDGTFSGETGGMIKSFGNKMVGTYKYIPHTQNATSFDAYEASSRDEQVPASYTCIKGGTSYNNFDTNAAVMYAYTPDAAADVPGIVKSQYGAGRMQHGDFIWTFNNATEDKNYSVITALKQALLNYTSPWKGFYGNVVNENPGSENQGGGDGGENQGGEEPGPGEGGDSGETPVASAIEYTLAANSVKDTDYVGKSFTIAGSYIAQNGGSNAFQVTGQSDKGTKFRTTADKHLVLNVNEGYVITGIEVAGDINTGTSLVLEGIYADASATNLLPAAVTFPTKKGNPVGYAKVSDFEATSQVELKWDDASDATQYNMLIAISYKSNAGTGISMVSVDNLGNAKVYDLTGKRISEISKGMYIVNGKKIMIK